jgi:hypothetical protein
MRLLVIPVLVLICVVKASCQVPLDSIIQVLRTEIDKKGTYVDEKRDRIKKLRGRLSSDDPLPLQAQFDIYNALYHEYKTFIYDSAFTYARKLITTSYQLGDRSLIGYARVKMGFILISSGMFKETFDSLNRVEVRYLHDTTRVDYFRLLARAYSDLIVYNKDDYYKALYNKYSSVYMDSAMKWCEPGSYNSYYLTSVSHIHRGEFSRAIGVVNELLAKHKLSYPQLAVNYYDLAEAYGGLQEADKNVEFLVRSSLSDIRAATKETAAMYTLAKVLHERGDTKDASVFIRQALDDAAFYGARQRKVEISAILPLIASAELSDSETERKWWFAYAIGLTILSLVIIAFAVIIYKQMKRLKAAEGKISDANHILQETNHKLEEANKIKEEYIGYYFSVNSDYLDKLESFSRSVEQKLTARKFDDIRFLISNVNSKKDREELYFSFDKVFLKLFPDFVKTFNSYLKPEEQFILKDGQLLNTELRIFALIRMGITDNEDIARILGYSVNTIYAYKSRIRNKSILPNEVFDEKIMEIKAI